MAKTRINFSTAQEVPDILKELAEANNRNVSNYLTDLIIREYRKLKLLGE